MAIGEETGGLLSAIQFDLKRLHETWMELLFPRQLDADETVLGKWKPQTPGATVAYRLWSALGVPTITLLYPLVLLGLIVRFQTRRIGGTASRLGVVGVVVLTIVVWGVLTVLARVQFDLAPGGFLAVGAASGVAVVTSALAVGARKVGGRFTTVVFAYPFAMTTIFLPPVVAALYSNQLASVVFGGSDTLAYWMLWNVLDFGGINTFLIENFDREGLAYVAMWFGIAVPLGWLFGVLVSLANYVRPHEED